MSQASELFPNPVPQNEVVLLSEPLFTEACKSHIADAAEKLGWLLGNSMLTRNENWGLVWRVDFATPSDSANSALVNRAICWGGSDGKDIGTAVVFGKSIDRIR